MSNQKGNSLVSVLICLVFIVLIGVIAVTGVILPRLSSSNTPAPAPVSVAEPVSVEQFVAREYKKCAEKVVQSLLSTPEYTKYVNNATPTPPVTMASCEDAIIQAAYQRSDAAFSLDVTMYLTKKKRQAAGASAAQ